MKCHGPTGLGDGQQDDYDNWSKAVKKFEDDTTAMVASIAADKKALSELDGEEYDAAAAELAAKERNLSLRESVASDLLPPRNARRGNCGITGQPGRWVRDTSGPFWPCPFRAALPAPEAPG